MLLAACDEPHSEPDAPLARAPTSTSILTPQPTPTATAIRTPVPTPTQAPTATATPQPTPTATAIHTPVPTPTQAPTATATPQPTPTATAIHTPVPTPTQAPTATATPQPTPTATAIHTPVPTPTQAPTATATPQSTPTATAIHTPVPTPTLPPMTTPIDTATPTPVLVVKLALDANATVVGYWSDGTADVEIAATLRNEGDLGLDHAVRVDVTCDHHAEVINDCGQGASVSLPDGYGPMTETLTMRLPAGEVSFEIDYGGESVRTLSADVPKRIVGVDRDVWECFSDTSRLTWDEDEGIGCAGWSRQTILKWGRESPVRLWLNGPDGFAAEFKDVLTSLSPIVNLQFEWVDARSDADVSAYIGLTFTEVEAEGVYCRSIDSFGCAATKTLRASGRIVAGEIIVYNLWPDRGQDFSDFDDWYRSRFRSAMIHEAVHLFARMLHRTESFSIMNSATHHRAELTPMDEALLRLHGHELVKPGMTIADIKRQIVFSDDLLDPQPIDPRLQAKILVSNAYRGLREATSARFRVRSSSPSCAEEFGWADYYVGNLMDRHPLFGWVRIDDGENHYYVLQTHSGEFEYWRQSGPGWAAVSLARFSDAVDGWRGELSDPHHMLESILYYADWRDVGVSVDPDGRATLRFELDMTRGAGLSSAGGVEVVVVIDEETYALLEYSMEWGLSNERCDTYQIEARDGQLDIDFTFPRSIRERSDLIDSCEVESLGFLSGILSRTGTWPRECGPGRSVEGYAQPYQFSLNRWSFVRFELSGDDISINLLRNDGSSNSPTVNLGASGHFIRRDDRQLRWTHVSLAPGSYTVEAVAKDRVMPGVFTLAIDVQPTPPPPYRFKSVTAGDWRTCGLLSDGTPLCWGIGKVEGEGAEMPEGRFTSISSGWHTCALREDGTPVCWDFKEEGEHTCSHREDGIYCLRNNQAPPSPEPSERHGDVVLATVRITVQDGYYVQTPPAGEKLVSISTGWAHSCGLREDGTPVCWGSNQNGKASPPAGERFKSIDAGTTHSCGLLEDGTAMCWGSDWLGELSVPEAARFAAITAGNDTCGLREDGSIECWGNGALELCTSSRRGSACRILGSRDDFLLSPPEGERFRSLSSGRPLCALRIDGTPVCWSKTRSPLVPTPTGERFTSISSSLRHACGLREDGSVACWGQDNYGQSSPPSGVNLSGMQIAQAPVGLVSISSGGYHTCALDSDGDAMCWGPYWWHDRFAERLTSIISGEAHSCGLREDGTAVCRGSDRRGQSSPPPGEVFTTITGGAHHSCGLRPGGTALCWGSNYSGQSTPPTGEFFASISSGHSHSCGLREDGSVACWGDAGDGRASPPPDEKFVSISSGYSHTCGLRADGATVCWGSNSSEQSTPPAGGVFTSVSAGDFHSCGLRKDGTVVCWGGNGEGQASPPPDEKFVSISSGYSYTCALRADGTAVCWGNDDFGQASPQR